MPKPRRIEVLRPGTFTPMAGEPVTFSEGDLRALAAAYDAEAAPAPAVVGHPKTDDPAYGWATAFAFDEASKRLVAEIGDLEPSFAEAVATRRYRKISLSLFTPAAANNPKPGCWYPKHIGFLGAAAPAVSGLKPVALAGDDGAITFEFADAAALRDVATLFQKIREWMIETVGMETADRVVDAWTIKWIDDAGDRPARDETSTGVGFAAPQNKEPSTMDTRKSAEQEAALAERESKVAERERALAHADNAAFAERLVSERRLLPALKDKVVCLLDAAATPALDVSFAEGDKATTSTVIDLLKAVLQAQPEIVSFGAVDQGASPADLSEPGVVAAMATEHMNQKARDGVVVSATDAVDFVTKGKSK